MRDFKDKEELYSYLKMMPKKVYERYLSNIRTFLKSPQAQLFSPHHFAQILFEAMSADASGD